jgi:hypothetical protein
MTTISHIGHGLALQVDAALIGLTMLLGALVAAEEVGAQERGVGAALLIGVGARQDAAGLGTAVGEVALEHGRWEVRATAGYQRFLDPECPAPPPVVNCDKGGTLVADLIGVIRPGPAGRRRWSFGVGPGFLTNGSVPYLSGLVGWQTGLGENLAFRVEARARALLKNGTHAEALLLIGVSTQ